ncbi:hypothetical protein FSARC_4594 [Fusarium sarcochroum]|uniref:Uncharacterized protein n=1 Tax=Fusarium sarcochroum TaxID=1208366 RepID=A0A8H4U178_9HYPO|nr:hypothetical protein FSARC_4594 [Fusarium sarcochroum]
MRPVKISDIKPMLDRGPVLILDRNRFVISFLQQAIRRSPKHVSTKTGDKSLPTEIWLQIFQELETMVHHNPVYPVKIRPMETAKGKTEPALICNVLSEWPAYGQIEDETMLRVYEHCLDQLFNNPDVHRQRHPFKVSETVRKWKFSIPISLLKSRNNFLFNEVKAPDMIAWVEDGECLLCNGRRGRSLVGREGAAACDGGWEKVIIILSKA